MFACLQQPKDQGCNVTVPHASNIDASVNMTIQHVFFTGATHLPAHNKLFIDLEGDISGMLQKTMHAYILAMR